MKTYVWILRTMRNLMWQGVCDLDAPMPGWKAERETFQKCLGQLVWYTRWKARELVSSKAKVRDTWGSPLTSAYMPCALPQLHKFNKKSQAWRLTPVNPAFKRLRQGNCQGFHTMLRQNNNNKSNNTFACRKLFVKQGSMTARYLRQVVV